MGNMTYEQKRQAVDELRKYYDEGLTALVEVAAIRFGGAGIPEDIGAILLYEKMFRLSKSLEKWFNKDPKRADFFRQGLEAMEADLADHEATKKAL